MGDLGVGHFCWSLFWLRRFTDRNLVMFQAVRVFWRLRVWMLALGWVSNVVNVLVGSGADTDFVTFGRLILSSFSIFS